jgi:hypothetical protein
MIRLARLASALGIAAAVAGLATTAAAQGMGLDGLHAQRREGGRVCMSDHFHHGTSAGQPTKKAAEVAAIQDWAGFTSLEYGSAWGNYALAASKSMQCSQASSGWSCELDARPCRRGR